MKNQESAESRRRQLDVDMVELFRRLDILSARDILRDVVGTDRWREVATELGFCARIANLPPRAPKSVGGTRNAPLKKAALLRWSGFMPTIDGMQVNLLEALVMRSELADDPDRAAWNSREVPYRVAEAILPYASYD